MRRYLWLAFVVLMAISIDLQGQTFEVGSVQDLYKGYIGETIKVPVRLSNNTDKPLLLIVRRVSASLGGTQKNYFCPGNTCLDQIVEDVLLRVEPRETMADFHIALDAGLANGLSSVKYLVFNRYNPSDNIEFDLNFSVEERSSKADVYSSPHIILHDVYPNPVVDHAFVNYALLNPEIDARIVIHNILGNPVEEHDLSATENKIKIRAETMNAGIYFYTLYLDNEGVVTRKLIVKK